MSSAECVQGSYRWLRHRAVGNKHLLARAPLYVENPDHMANLEHLSFPNPSPASTPFLPRSLAPTNEAVHYRCLLLPTLCPSFNLLAWQVQRGEGRNFRARLDVRNVYICAAMGSARLALQPDRWQQQKAGGSAEKRSSASERPSTSPLHLH